MNKELLKLIGDFNSLQAEREEIQSVLDQETKSQKVCKTQLKNLEKRLVEKMERRDEMLGKYKSYFQTVLLETSPNSIVVDEETYCANLELNLFGKDYNIFSSTALSAEVVGNSSKLYEEFVDDIVTTHIILGKPYNKSVEAMLNLNKEISKNPVLAKEVREVLDENKAERHIRGGMATKLKYLREKHL